MGKALAVFAHPDDAEFLAGGSVALWAQNSTAVTYVVVTNGDKGTEDPKLTSDELAAIREDEVYAINNETCQKCGICEDTCPPGAIRRVRRRPPCRAA